MIRRVVRVALGLACLTGCGAQNWRREPPPRAEDLAIAFPALECRRAGEGPQICVVELPHSPIVALGLSLAVGARHDPPDARGAAEATLAAIFDARDERGASLLAAGLGEFGGPAWPAIAADGALLATYTLPSHLGPALQTLTDLVRMPPLDERAAEAARATQCRRANEALGDPVTLAQLAVRRALLPRRHPGTLPALRTQICHEPLPLAQATELARAAIAPENVALLVAGPVTADDIAPLVAGFAAWTAPARRPTTFEVTARAAGEVTIVDVSGLAQTVIVVGGLSERGLTADDPGLGLAVGYAAGSLHDALRGDLGATYSVSDALVPAGDRALWLLTTRVDAAATRAALNAIAGRMRFLGERSPDASSVFTSRVHALVAAMRSFAVAVGAVEHLADAHLAGAPIDQVFERARDVRAIQADDVGQLLRTAFSPAHVVLVGDAGELRKIGALADAAVVRPISVLEQ